MSISHFTPFANTPFLDSLAYPKTTVSTVTGDTTNTLTTAQLLGGFILLDGVSGGTAATTPTAVLLVAAMNGARVGSAFEFTIRNTAASSYTITVAAGTGGTTSGTMTIAQSNSKRFMVVLTNVTSGSEAYYLYSLGTFVH